MSFQIGQTFFDAYPPEAAAWCNKNNAYIVKEAGKFIIKAVEEPSLEELKEEKIKQIDQETSESILSGFTYTIKDKERFFSYDSFDQQNFADAANTALLSQMQSNVKTIPTNVNWNSYVGEEKELEIITLDASEFLDLYINGALVHKNTKMQIGGQRKAKVAEAQSEEDLDKI